MALDLSLPLQSRDEIITFTAANGTQAKILVPAYPAQVMAAVPGETALPTESTVRQRIFTGGGRIIDGTIASTDAAAKSVLVYKGTLVAQNVSSGNPDGTSATGTLVITSQNILTRTVGSYITDGWLVGDTLMLFGETTTTANNGVLGTVTAVTATTLTVNGTPFTNATLVSGVGLYKVSLKCRIAVPANSGNSDTIPNVNLIANGNDNGIDKTGEQMGPNGVLICAMVAAVAALPAYITVSARVMRL